MVRTRKKYEELTIIDDFMFGKVMRNPKIRGEDTIAIIRILSMENKDIKLFVQSADK